MLNLKKTAVAVLAFGSSAVFAGTMGPICAPGNVTVPCASTAWDFGVQALYLQSTYSGVGYIGSTHVGTAETYTKAPQNWGWGFKLEGSYHFNTGNDLNINWYYLDNTKDKNFSTVAGDYVFGLTPSTGNTLTAATSDKVQWDAVNVEFGQHAHFGEVKNIRFHGGVQYAYINNKLTANLANVVTATGVTSTSAASNNVSYSGFGPRIGADYWYNWGNGFAMYAKGASAVLVGTQQFKQSLTSLTGTAFAASVGSSTGSTTAIVPELEGKLGATYTYAMAQGDLSLDLGWMWVNYFEALQTNSPATAAGAGHGLTDVSNFGVQGPFVGLKWVGNVA